MRLQRALLRNACFSLSLSRRAHNSSASQSPIPSQVKQARSKSPFDSLGYQLLDQQTTSQPQATQRTVIDALGPSSFTISGVRVTGAVLVMPFFSTLWNIHSAQQIRPHAFSLVKLIAPRPDVVLIGTGTQLLPISPELRQFFRHINVNVDAMDTKNACHTFNVLNQEGRNAAAALLPVGYTHNQEIS